MQEQRDREERERQTRGCSSVNRPNVPPRDVRPDAEYQRCGERHEREIATVTPHPGNGDADDADCEPDRGVG